ncbi:tripartite tricarboxylate transporter substrate binding protein [Xylophilus rhododendri]|uniref:Tripartite tricarboxylate transporter substrate binding protein n=1 Tax=Xylophilus rhododendri TaxID=2697032 RepID=A0A857JC26_9BURK|nr:tripartite tricarboxylate transporter substrate binding protein [Xylophilus rhododendri]QHJ00513.1 tripartite tricarboxylate transporter substrate binding protein [Xylophilus rhododendri]
MKKMLPRGLLALCCLLGASALQAQEPALPKLIKIVVPFSPGGSNDLFARALGQKLSVKLGVNFIVENKPGASGAIGAQSVATAEPDGATLLLNSVSFTTNAAVATKLPYDPIKSFAPVALLNRGPMLLIVGNATPYKTPADVLKAIRSPAKDINYGSAGLGSIGQMASELLNSSTGGHAVHVPYKGISNAVADMMGGNLQIMITTAASVAGPLKGNMIRPVAVTSPTRSNFMPGLPALAESVPGFSVESWWGVFAPAKTPKPLVDRLNREIRSVADTAEMRELFARESTEPSNMSPEQFGDYLQAEVVKWRKLAQERNITAD